MDRIVLKWPLSLGETKVPGGFVRQVAFQRGELFAWIEHPSETHRDPKMTLEVVATGQSFTPDNCYVGTAVSDDLVWHVYAR